MNKTAAKTKNSPVSGCPIEQNGTNVPESPPSDEISGVTAEELQSSHDEKLAAICQAIEKGDYDSDAILEKALNRMLERLAETENE